MPTFSRIPLYTTVCDKPPPPGAVATRSPAERAADHARREASKSSSETPAISADVVNGAKVIEQPADRKNPSPTDADQRP
ncbi:MAG TPA: hypothetical protein VHR72_05665 [Gemmataceae bacterium]|jgi:hypothetical protein|nr:hypothetical protein [Gemmataceae bacterium]